MDIREFARRFAGRAPAPRRCVTCRYFQDYREDFGIEDPEEANGYCEHPFHHQRGSPHRAYGGHWTHSAQSCPRWRAA